jgi:hypothetical protein
LSGLHMPGADSATSTSLHFRFQSNARLNRNNSN